MSDAAERSVRVRRWRIRGTLETITPLHMGTGGVEKRPELRKKRSSALGRKDDPEVRTVVLDCNDRPCLTATGLKGAMLSWCRAHLAQAGAVTEDDVTLFGTASDNSGQAAGGRLEIHVASMNDPGGHAPSPTPFWNAARRTDVDVGVRINRASGTALDRHLFHKEVVAPRTAFSVVIDLDVPPQGAGDGTTLLERALALLAAFNLPSDGPLPPLAMGAMTGRGHGRFTWTPDTLSRVTDDSLKAWIQSGAKQTWEQALTPLPAAEQAARIKAGQAILDQATGQAEVICSVTLAFDHRFLVSEPGRAMSEMDAKEANKRKNPDSPNVMATSGIMPKVDHDDREVLPTASVKGVLRSRAERILATLTGDETPFDHAPGRGPAGLDDPQAKMMTEGRPTERLFGAASWCAALAVDPFEPVDEARPATTQELVAIDRFTGGASGSAKYAIDAFDRPRFAGRLRLDLTRAKAEDLGLLVLVLRDLVEGDLTFGHGTTKGYGGALASVTVQARGVSAETEAMPVDDAHGPGFDAPVPWENLKDVPALAGPLRHAVHALRVHAAPKRPENKGAA